MISGDRIFLGASRGIGLAMLEHQIKISHDRFFAFYRDDKRANGLLELQKKYPEQLFIFQANVTDEIDWPLVIKWLEPFNIKIGHVFNSVGFLSFESIKPEKSIRDFNQEHMLETLRINTTTLPMALKYLQGYFAKEIPFVIASISAKVGSITDNQLGGWYSYRASKAAHNMLIKTLALEFERRYPKSSIIALHPGTVDTDLSRPFSSNIKHQVFTVQECAEQLYRIIDESRPENTGRFFSWDGSVIPW